MNRPRIFLSLLILAGCGTVNSITLNPSPTALNPSAITWNGDQRDTEGFWCSIITYGLGPSFSAGDGQTLSGFEDFFDPGSGPFPCVVHSDDIYRGVVAFDLSQFNTIVSADLKFTVDASVTGAPPNFVGQNPAACNATTLGMASASDLRSFDNPVSLPPCGPSLDVGVSDQVRQWIAPPPATPLHPNFGFVIAGPKLSLPDNLPDDNNTNVTWYGNFQLTVLYDPMQNPRAPQ
jgi:hypothetical protein